ncbi:hypothetical protein FVQ98_14630 [Ottowia sp. GY511]|uniref:Uncharacterized protein n=1 Tax=Ottowia flava TaxID=2675430 RepID=A0ABW4KLQ5_9BURK|nr:hypothetical protein [Ottowia sp. GY511]TXK26390.1 hypothetical protein FVQ98_14630 [Ottowia sp. GY511]
MRKSLIAALSSALAITGAFAQQSGGKQSRARSTASPVGQKIAPMAPSPFKPAGFVAGTPLPSYLSNDPVKVYGWLSDLIREVPGKPDKFSTTDDRNTYVAAVAQKIQSVGPIAMPGSCRNHYKSDEQKYLVTAIAVSVKDYSAVQTINAATHDLRVISLQTVNKRTETYTGQNAYGAETQVSKITSDPYSIAIPKTSIAPIYKSGVLSSELRYSSYGKDFGHISVGFPMPSNEARANDSDIQCMYVVTFAAPTLFEYTDRTSPTRDLPFETIQNFHAMYGSLNQFFVFNKTTGQIYAQAFGEGGAIQDTAKVTPTNSYCAEDVIERVRSTSASEEEVARFCGRR